MYELEPINKALLTTKTAGLLFVIFPVLGRGSRDLIDWNIRESGFRAGDDQQIEATYQPPRNQMEQLEQRLVQILLNSSSSFNPRRSARVRIPLRLLRTAGDSLFCKS